MSVSPPGSRNSETQSPNRSLARPLDLLMREIREPAGFAWGH